MVGIKKAAGAMVGAFAFTIVFDRLFFVKNLTLGQSYSIIGLS